ncbi:MAG: ABC transporter substrate-binding protein [Prolixibacteraceae bacterium]|nr:ABC transporter substrate-binding protein [Prolixibacteraceae bacterium]
MNLRKIYQPVLFFVFLAAILLLSDISNRKKTSVEKKENFDISVIHWIDAPAIERVEKGIFSALSDNGLEAGKNISVSFYKASSDISMLNSIFKQVHTQKPDLIFVTCTPALQAAINHIKEIPVVYAAVADPILVGAGTDASHHLHNVTGGCLSNDFETMCRIITENAPHIKTLGSIYCPGEIISVKYRDDYIKTASEYGLNVKFFPANNASELPDAVLSMVTSKIDAVCQMGDNLMSSGVSTLIKGVTKANIPYFSFNERPEGTPMNCIVEIDIDYVRNGYDAGLQAVKILVDKIKPGDIPFNPPTKSEVRLNPEIALKYGIQFSGETRENAMFVKGEKEPFVSKQKIALVHFVSSPDCNDVEAGIFHRFGELGNNRDQDFTMDIYNANADVATLNDIVKMVSHQKYDLIFSTVLAATQALSSKITDTPILFTVVADPVRNGLGKSYSDHIPNLAGIDGMIYADRGVDLITKYLPEATSLGVLYCPGEMASVSGLNELEKSCREQGIVLKSIPVNMVTEVSDATELLCLKKIDAICQLPDNCTIPGFMAMVKITRKHKMPLFCFITSQVEMGAVAAVAGDFFQQGIEIANMAIEVINGKSPSEIPYSRIKSIKTVINPEAAKAYGLETPHELYKIADIVIDN